MSSLAAASALLALAAPIAGPAGRLYVDDGGRGGLPVVFVHSFAGSSGHWAAQLGGYTVDGLAADIAAVADGLGLKRFVPVGHSMGGVAAIAYAGVHPGRVAGLHNLAPEISRKVITGTSHWPHMDKPAEFNAILDDFLKTVH